MYGAGRSNSKVCQSWGRVSKKSTGTFCSSLTLNVCGESRMKVLQNISQLATCRAEGGQGDIHPIADGAVAWEGDTIRWVGPRRELPREYQGAEVIDAGGALRFQKVYRLRR